MMTYFYYFFIFVHLFPLIYRKFWGCENVTHDMTSVNELHLIKFKFIGREHNFDSIFGKNA